VQPAHEVTICECRLDGVLTVVEVACDPEDRDVAAVLGHHLLALDVAHPVRGVEDGDAGVRPVGEPLEGRLSRVPRGGHEDEVVIEHFAGAAAHRDRLREEQRHALERHVLESARRAVPELENVHVSADLDDWGDPFVVERCPVSGFHERVDLLRMHVDGERLVDAGGTSRVRKARQREISSSESAGTRSGTYRPPPGAIPASTVSVKVRGIGSRPRVSR